MSRNSAFRRARRVDVSSNAIPLLRTRRTKRPGRAPRSRRLFLEPLEDRRLLSTFTVNTINDTVDEQTILDLEREAFLSLCGEPKTHQRIEALLKTGKPLRN